MYLTRQLEEKIKLLAEHFKVVLLLGARQVGKSTLLRHLFPHMQCIVFDSARDMFAAKEDPDLFLNNFPAPIILDEVQYVPELLAAIKRRVDEQNGTGQYILTGSHNLMLLKQVAESMAGRVGIVELSPLSFYELKGQDTDIWLNVYLQNPDNILAFKKSGTLPQYHKNYQYTVYETIWRGGMPGILDFPEALVSEYFSSYTQTYLERDIRVVEYVTELPIFARFMGVLSALSAQEINYSQLGREIGIQPKTAMRWLNIMQTCYQWHEILPYQGNVLKRLSKKSKGYMNDTGLACYLQYVSEPKALALSRNLGALFETWVVNQVRTASKTLPHPIQLYHWRAISNAEVDILLEYNGTFYPIEIKCKTNLHKHDASGIMAFRATYPELNIARGIIVYAGDTVYLVNQYVIAVPWHML